MVATGDIRDRVRELRRVRAGDLVPNPKNWRRHSEAQRKALAAMLADVGFAGVALARELDDGRLMLVDGHLRSDVDVEAVIPVAVLDVDEAEADRILATFDPIGAMAVADTDALEALLGEVELPADLEDTFAGLTGSSRHPGFTDPDEVPALPGPGDTRTAPGELWALGDHRLLVGDACSGPDLERVMEGHKADLLFTDPPYGVSYAGGSKPREHLENDERRGADLEVFAGESMSAAAAVLRRGAAFYVCAAGTRCVEWTLGLAAAGLEMRQLLVWVKDQLVMGRSDFHYRSEVLLTGGATNVREDPGSDEAWRHEAILYGWAAGTHEWHGGRKQDTVWEVPRPKRSVEHPTMKPVELVARAVALSSSARGRVLDPFAGSGSTLIAAQQLGRRCHAVEIEPAYCDVVLERWEAFTGEKAVRL